MKRVIIRTCAYNAEATLRRAVDSILSQNFCGYSPIYILVDNGSTDSTGRIVEEYAKKIDWIIPSHNVVNKRGQLSRTFPEILDSFSGEGYFLNLDADDMYLQDFFEKMLQFMNKNQLDIAACGSKFIDRKTGKCTGLRMLEKDLVIQENGFASNFIEYYQFLRTVWGKVFSLSSLRKCDFELARSVNYGSDTILTMEALRHSNRFGILSQPLHKYYYSKTSSSFKYDPIRFNSDVTLYNFALEFLSNYGLISDQNYKFLQTVYAYAITDTINVIIHSELSLIKKLENLCIIASNPITKEMYHLQVPDIVRSKSMLMRAALTLSSQSKNTDTLLHTLLQELIPKCGSAVTESNASLFLKDNRLWDALLMDNRDMVLEILLNLIENNCYTKQYDLGKMVQTLSLHLPLLSHINSVPFLQKYGRLYKMIWQGKTLEALDKMTGLLLEDLVNKEEETYLQLYLSLAAVSQQPTAYVFGHLRLAEFYVKKKMEEKCRAELVELEEMGLENTPELENIRRALDSL